MIRRHKTILLVIAAFLLFTGAAMAADSDEYGGEAIVATAYSPTLGTYLTDAEGRALYLFEKDEIGVTNCYERCAQNWPPFTVESADDLIAPEAIEDGFGVIPRKDGTLQVTYNGMPLYTWVGDKKPGDTTGHEVGDVWYVVNPLPTVKEAENDELGEFLVDANGMTLYLFTKDEMNVSNCSGRCAQNWPPLLVAEGGPVAGRGVEKGLGVITRADGTHQVTYEGKPLYLWVKDHKPGDTTGQGVGEVWYVVHP